MLQKCVHFQMYSMSMFFSRSTSYTSNQTVLPRSVCSSQESLPALQEGLNFLKWETDQETIFSNDGPVTKVPESFEPVSPTLLWFPPGYQIMAMQHLAIQVNSFLQVSSCHNVFMCFDDVWPYQHSLDINTDLRVIKCHKFLHYNCHAVYTQAITSIFGNTPRKIWNDTTFSEYFYDSELKNNLFPNKSDAVFKPFVFLSINPDVVSAMNTDLERYKSPFVIENAKYCNILPLYADYTHYFGNEQVSQQSAASSIIWVINQFIKACEYGAFDIYNFLMSKGVDRILVLDNLNKGVICACHADSTKYKNNRMKILNHIINLGAQVPTLHEVAPYGFIEAAKLFYDVGSNIESKNLCGDTVLHYLCNPMNYFPKFLDFLLDCDKIHSIINMKNDDDETPLLTAINSKYHGKFTKRICEKLLNTGLVDVEATNYGLTPMCIASRYGYTDIMELLLDYGAERVVKRGRIYISNTTSLER